MITPEEIQLINRVILNKRLSAKQIKNVSKRISDGSISDKQYLFELMLSADFLKYALNNVLDFHLYYIHFARIKLITHFLPQADIILDLGGANSSICDLGYPHKFQRITLVDLPPKDRVDMYKSIVVTRKDTPNGLINVHFGNMCKLGFVKPNSVDLVWLGEAIEHVTEADGKTLMKEVFRVLKPGGIFCLDTPNRLLTEIHTRGIGGGYIHPEHKIEYYPQQLQRALKKAGFRIIDKKGLCNMVNSYGTKNFDYEDFVIGNPITENIDSSYIQYYQCQKPLKQNFIRPRLSSVKA